MKNNGSDHIQLPESYTRRQLNALYREIPLKDTVSRTLRKYFNAMANLYGVITLEKAFEIIWVHNPRLVTEEEFLAFAEIARHECEDYLILGDDELYTDGKIESPFDREIIDVLLIDEDIERYIQTKQSQQGKPFYIPDKQQLLLYDDAFYFEETPEATELMAFLIDQLKLTEEAAAAAFAIILYGSRYLDTGIAEALHRLEDEGLAFKTDADLHKFIQLEQNFHNTTRMQCNRGHTPDELFRVYSPKERAPRSISLGANIRKGIADGTIDVDQLRRDILKMDMPSEELRLNLLKELADIENASKGSTKSNKVGQNDPCPCGSGKKYKKCCGQ